jgi:hypothetical protein
MARDIEGFLAKGCGLWPALVALVPFDQPLLCSMKAGPFAKVQIRSPQPELNLRCSLCRKFELWCGCVRVAPARLVYIDEAGKAQAQGNGAVVRPRC